MTSKAELKRFRAIGHKLKPNVIVAGKGLSESVVSEIKRSLADHELIKIRVNTDDRKDRDETIASIVEQTTSTVIQTIGSVALLYKAAKKPNPKLSNILRSELL